jgi:2-oxoglutarate dehydrogenase E2 component (dihydrolipoamide succinyltransferase)/2-oxoisovalerate dehydrogenase E2 component (dihydrolipoyl transacylase)
LWLQLASWPPIEEILGVFVATDIIMPQLGESIAEGTVVKWLIPLGGLIEKDQSLLEVETEKVDLEVPSPATGVLNEILVKAGETVAVGTLLARIDSAPPAEVINRVGGVVVRPVEPAAAGEEHHSPAVRQLAKEHGVDLTLVKGTGTGGRVTKKDVLEFVARERHAAAAPAAGVDASMGEELLPLTQMRKTIADRMVKSRQTSAHVSTFFEADFSSVAAFRAGRELTYLPFIVRAVTRALRDVPIVNSMWGDQGIVVKKDLHIGIATALEEGLLVPVVRHADRKGLMQLAKEIVDLAERARSKRLTPDEVQGGTFTITNHGGFGSLFSTPIIHQPQIAILGVGAVQKRTVVINEAIAIRPMGYLSLSFDHRVIDGATADQFMAKVKHNLEQSHWEQIL